MHDQSLRAFMAGWQKLIAAVEAHEVELPEVSHYKADLELAVAELKTSKARQTELEKRRRQATREVCEQKADCRELALRLKSLILAHFGPKDERLADFGIQRRGRRTRKSKELEKKSGSPGYH
ncbi:MAG TPA: hypothetical protein VGX68_02345 [Thermoanaerobaculia bacterium]|jgi:hypothetical protein|nr:hypothetical protein [Thermoanaerobaculia bacterium]